MRGKRTRRGATSAEPTRRRGTRLLIGAAGLALLASAAIVPSRAAATTATGSIVFLKGGNVFLSDPQGTKQFQVTQDGTPTDPYLSPSEDDNGVVYAVRGNRLFRLGQNGTQAAPPVQLEPTSSRGVVSADGSTVAYQALSFCVLGICENTHYKSLPSEAKVLSNPSFHEASWAGPNVLGITAGNVYARKAGQSDPAEWSLPELPALGVTREISVAGSADGTRVAKVGVHRPDGLAEEDVYLFLYSATGVGGAAQLFCVGQLAAGSLGSKVSFSADGATVTWDEPDGVWTMDVVDVTPTKPGCDANVANAHLLIPGGSSPSWSNAAASPQPVPPAPAPAPAPAPPAPAPPAPAPAPAPPAPKSAPAPTRPAIDKSVQIRFVRWDSPGRDTRTNRSINGEVVQLINTSTRHKSLTGYTLRDTHQHIYKFPKTAIGPGKTLTVRSGRGTATATKRYWGLARHVWDNRKDVAQLRDPYRRLTDSVRWSKPGKGSAIFT